MEKNMTRKQFRKEVCSNIKEIADFSDNGAIQCNVELIRQALNNLNLHKDPNVKKIEQYLNSIEECCKVNFAKTMQSYHAFEMMHHFALAIGDKYDPMY